MSYEQIWQYTCNLCEVVEHMEEGVLPKDWVHVAVTPSAVDSRITVAAEFYEFCPKCASIVKHTMENKGG